MTEAEGSESNLSAEGRRELEGQIGDLVTGPMTSGTEAEQQEARGLAASMSRLLGREPVFKSVRRDEKTGRLIEESGTITNEGERKKKKK